MGEPTQAEAIEIRIEKARQLFNMLDPFPFRERDLDPEAERYIVGWAREVPSEKPVRIVVHLPEPEARSEVAADISDAVHNFFAYRAQGVGRDLKELFRVGRRSLLIGAMVLGLCLLLAQAVTGQIGVSAGARFVEESLIIVGWVANWRPIEIFLYEWWPLVRQRRLYGRLARAEIEVRAERPTALGGQGAAPPR